VLHGCSFFFFGSWVFGTFGSVLPSSRPGSLPSSLRATGPVVSASALPLTRSMPSVRAPSAVPFVPVFQIFDSRPAYGNFTAFGA
jgi:hypothetical protein